MTQLINSVCPGSYNNALLQAGQDLQWDHANNLDKDPIWIPEILEFEYPVKLSEHMIIESNPKGVIQLSETDENYIKGFIL